MDSLSEKRRIIRGFSCVISGFFLHFLAGLLLSAGLFLPYIASYMYWKDPSMEISILFNIHTVILFTEVLGIWLSETLSKYYSSRRIALCGTLSIGVLFMFLPYISSPLVFSLVFGTSLGTLSGLCLNSSLWISTRHFPSRSGLVIGILMSGFGLSSSVWSVILHYLFNPNNMKPEIEYSEAVFLFEEEVASRLPEGFIVVGGTIALVGILSSIGLLSPHVEAEHDSCNSKEFKQAAKSRQFIILFVGQVLACSWWLSFVGLIKEYALIEMKNDETATQVLTIAATFGVLGRIAWGKFMDSYGHKKVMLFLVAVNVALVPCIPFSNTSPVLFCFISSFVYFTCGGFAAAIVQSFGHELSSKLFSVGVIFQPLDSLIYMGITFLITKFGFFYYWIVADLLLVLAGVVVFHLEDRRVDKRSASIEGFEYIKLE